jgi:putative ABC transport system ATP-binding protein
MLVCDEPTSALDAENGRVTMELIAGIAVQQDRVVIVVTHDTRVYPYADRIATMEDGQIVSVEDRHRQGEVRAPSAPDGGRHP